MKTNFKNHYWQCVSNCFINKRKWWDFVSFDPRLDYDSGYHVVRVVPTEQDIDLISEKVEAATKLKFQYLEQFTNNAA